MVKTRVVYRSLDDEWFTFGVRIGQCVHCHKDIYQHTHYRIVYAEDELCGVLSHISCLSAYHELSTMCYEALGTLPMLNAIYKERLELELADIKKQNEASYFIDLYLKGIKYVHGNNLIVPWLLGICDQFDINQDPAYYPVEYPDLNDYPNIYRLNTGS